MKKTIEEVVSVLKGVSTLDTMMKNTKIILLLLLSITVFGGAARGGHSTLDLVDPSFNPQIRTSSLSSGRIDGIIPLPNGKALVAGAFNSYNGQPVGCIARLNADGTLDTTFNVNLPNLPLSIQMARQADGKILAKIQVTYESYEFVRLNADGSADPTFNFDSGSPFNELWSFTIDANGRIILIGLFYDNNGYRRIIRLNPDGSRDQTFQFKTTEVILAAATQNNKIIIQWGPYIQRLNEDGTFDPSFITRNIGGAVVIFRVQPDRKILFQTPSYGSPPYSLRRLNENGGDDEGFTSSTFPAEISFTLGEDGRILLAVRTPSSNDYQIRRLLANGTADSSFTPYTAGPNNPVGFRFAVQADGGVLLGDSGITPLVTKIVRLFPNGSPDPAFNIGGTGFQIGGSGSVHAIDVQPDSKILIGGYFNHVNDVPRASIARLNSNATLDESFQINTSGTGNYFSRIDYFSNIRTQSDGKIVVTGYFDYVLGGVTKSNLVRLNSNGSIDPTFNLGVPIRVFTQSDTNRMNRFVTYNDGKLLVGTSRIDQSETVPVKLTATGARDTSFNANLYPQDTAVYINDVAVQPDGKIIVGGNHFLSGGILKSFLTRLNADGSLDTTFQSREQPRGEIRAFVLMPNGKIVIAETEQFNQFIWRGRVLRLNPDGSVDPTFEVGTTDAYQWINTLLLLDTGRIFVGGSFSTFSGQPRGNLVQLNADGSVFTPAYNFNSEVLSLAVDANGRVFVGGNFTTVVAGNSSASRSYVAGLIDSNTRFDFDGDGRADVSVFRPSDGVWYLNQSTNGFSATQFGVSTDKITPADYDGDGRTDISVYRDGTWYWLSSSNNSFNARQFGIASDIPVPANYYTGDNGGSELAVYRSGTWWILNLSNNQINTIQFGLATDKPLPADYDGDGRVDQAVYRNGEWHLNRSTHGYGIVHWGLATDKPVPADYDGDGKTDLAVYRDGTWYLLQSTNGFTAFQWGVSSDIPAPADYDGDGKAEAAVFRDEVWYLRQSTSGVSIQHFGLGGDKPVPAAYLP